MIDFRKELNEPQWKAVSHEVGPHLVIAGAGTGKTRTLTYRVAYLVGKGIDPDRILLLTFTRKAAYNMMLRASNLCDDRCRRVAGGTFHSFANHILRRYASLLGYSRHFTIADRSDAEDILGMICTELGLHKRNRRFPKKRTLLNIASRAINRCQPPERIILEEYPPFTDDTEAILDVLNRYAAFKQERSIMDYDDLLVHANRLLREHDHVRSQLSGTYLYIMVDEFQDTNRLQAEIAYALAAEHRNIMVVGDDCQSIYSFRGADFRNIMDFPRRFPDCTITTLEENYRSVQPILSFTNAIIENAKEKYSKNLFSRMDGGDKPCYVEHPDKKAEAEYVSREVALRLSQGVPPREIAVLFRAGWHSNQLEVALNRDRISFVKYGGIKFVEAAHIKDVLALARILLNPMDTVAWNRVLQLIEGVGPATARKLIEHVSGPEGSYEALVDPRWKKRKFAPVLQELRNLLTDLARESSTVGEAIKSLVSFYAPWMERVYDDAFKRKNDLESLIQMSEDYPSLETLLADLILESPEQTNFPTTNTSLDHSIVLSTIHSAKGLEWDTVFVIHLVDGYLPSRYCLEDEEAMEEERRLLYVAATRARKELILSVPHVMERGYMSWDALGPSRFLKEIRALNVLTLRHSPRPPSSIP